MRSCELYRRDDHRNAGQLGELRGATCAKRGARTTATAGAEHDHQGVLLARNGGETLGDVPDLAARVRTCVRHLVVQHLRGDARGRSAQILQGAEGYKEQAIAEAKGQSARFSKVREEYDKAKDVTRQRIYLETMERILGNSQKLVYDGGPSGSSIVPYLPLNELSPPRTTQPAAAPQTGGAR